MIVFDGQQIDWHIRHSWWFVCAGMGLASFALYPQDGLAPGFFSGITLLALGLFGTYFDMFRNWRADKGLWLLALVAIVILSPFWLYFEYCQILTILAWRANPPVPGVGGHWIALTIDSVVAFAVFSRACQLLLSIAIRNWRCTTSQAEQN